MVRSCSACTSQLRVSILLAQQKSEVVRLPGTPTKLHVVGLVPFRAGFFGALPHHPNGGLCPPRGAGLRPAELRWGAPLRGTRFPHRSVATSRPQFRRVPGSPWVGSVPLGRPTRPGTLTGSSCCTGERPDSPPTCSGSRPWRCRYAVLYHEPVVAQPVPPGRCATEAQGVRQCLDHVRLEEPRCASSPWRLL